MKTKTRDLKPLLKKLTPPVCVDIYKALFQSPAYSGPYDCFEDALKKSSGYDHPVIFEKVKASTHLMREDTAFFAQDGMSNKTPTYRYPVIATLLQQATQHGELCILDFGGALGTSYLAFRRFLGDTPLTIRWGIVEQSHYIDYGKKYLTSDSLQFFNTVEEARESIKPTVCLLSSSLQYLPHPETLLTSLFGYELDCIILDRIPTQDTGQHLIGVEHVPKQIYNASYPVWLFSYARLLSLCQAHYASVLPIECSEYPLSFQKHRIEYRGLILRSRSSVIKHKVGLGATRLTAN